MTMGAHVELFNPLNANSLKELLRTKMPRATKSNRDEADGDAGLRMRRNAEEDGEEEDDREEEEKRQVGMVKELVKTSRPDIVLLIALSVL